MNVIIKRVGCLPQPATIPEDANVLRWLQQAVDGYIEAVTIFDKLVVICNEEGRLRGLPYNCDIFAHRFVGDLVFVGVDGEEFTDVPEGALEVVDQLIYQGGNY